MALDQSARCATCKHWERNTFGIRTWRIREYEQVGECLLADDPAKVRLPLKGGALAICSTEGITGELLTHGEFGCVKHEARG